MDSSQSLDQVPMRFHRVIVWFVVSAAVSLCAAQTDSSAVHPDSLLKTAHRYLSRGSTDTARALFEAVLSSGLHTGQARLGLVQVAMAQEEWWDAAHLCDTLLKYNPHDIGAHYCAGICEREWGAQTAGIIRTVAWGRSRDHFDAVLASDSLYKDVLYQYARLKECQEELADAIALASRQLLLRPDQVDAQVGLFRIYRHYISEAEPNEVLPWLEGQGNGYGRYFAAEVRRRSRHLPEAEIALIQLLKEPSGVPPQACYLSLARIYASVNDDARAQFCYWKGIDAISSWLGAALVFEDLKYIIADKELEQYRSLSSDRLKSSFFHRFWQVRNPMPATAINYRLIEHLRRYVQAEEQFEYYGLRTGFSDPDRTKVLKLPNAFYLNKEFNDPGLIFLRQGPPNKIERTMGNAPVAWNPNDPMQRRLEDQVVPLEDRYNTETREWFRRIENANTYGPKAVDQHQSWLYFASGDEPQRIFHFALHNTASDNWRLTPLPGDPDYLDSEMLANLAMYDPRYSRLQKGGGLEATKLVADIQQDEEKVVATALATDRHVWNNGTKEFPVPHAIDAFRSSSGRTLLDVSYAIPYSSLREAAGASTKKVLVEVGISTTSPGGGRVIDATRDTLDLLLTPDGKGSYIGLFRQVLGSDSVRLVAHVRALEAPAVGTWTEHLRIPSFAGSEFMLSDLQLLLPATSGPLIEIDGVKVVQSPFRSYQNEKPFYAYLQVYNLVKDNDGHAVYTARFTLAPKDRPDASTVLGEIKRDLSDDSRSEFQLMDFQGVKPGVYTLTVSVTDKKRLQTLTRSREIEIIK